MTFGTISPFTIPDNLVALAEQPIDTNLSITDDLFVKWYLVQKADTFIPQHAHEHDHVTVIATGAVEVWVDGVHHGLKIAPTSFVVKAGALHTFKTMVDNVVLLCVHALDGEGEPKVCKENQFSGCGSCHSE